MPEITEPAEITVVVPTYNRQERLAAALASILSETKVPLRVHVFDNASTDGTIEVLEKMRAGDSRIHIFRHSENIGAEGNYIAALDSVETEYFVPLADDDRLKPGFLNSAWTRLQDLPDCGAAVFFSDCENDAGEVLMTYPHSEEDTLEGVLSPDQHMREFLLRGHYVWSGILWRKVILESVGYPYLHTGRPSDVDFQIAAFSRFPVCLSREIGAIYTSHDGQYSGGLSMRDIPSFAKMLARMDTAAAPLFSAEEYAGLRGLFLQRYGGIWKLPPDQPVGTAERARLAGVAAMRLGEWELAEHLMAEVPPEQGFDDPTADLIATVNALRRENDHLRSELHAGIAPATDTQTSLTETCDRRQNLSLVRMARKWLAR